MAAEPAAVRGRRRRRRCAARAAGEGPPVVLCHGITATRRYVLHGSRALERAGHTVVTYDARGHGESDPAPAGRGLWIPGAGRRPGARWSRTQVGEGRFVLAGHSMGAHTAVAYALAHPERLAGAGRDRAGLRRATIQPASLEYWDGLAAALESGGVDGFVAYIDEQQGIDPRLARLGAALHPRADAAAPPPRGAGREALREVPRSRPFELARRARGARGPGAGRRQPRRRRSRAIPTRPPRPTPRRCRGASWSARPRGSRRWPGRAASSRAP